MSPSVRARRPAASSRRSPSSPTALPDLIPDVMHASCGTPRGLRTPDRSLTELAEGRAIVIERSLTALPPSPQQAFTDAQLARLEAAARGILAQTGFAPYDGQWDSDACWQALNDALSHSTGPKSAGRRAERVLTCLALVRDIRHALADGRAHDGVRHALGLAALSEDLLTHAEHDAVIVPRQRRRGSVAAAVAKSQAAAGRRAEWDAEAAHVRADHPTASAAQVAARVATVCEANPETVRKGLRRPRPNHRP